MTEFNLGKAVVDRLIANHGFETSERIGEFRCVVDSQHALVYEDKQWHRSRSGGYSSVDAWLKVARRDVNELRSHVMDDEWSVWGPTFDVTREVRPGAFKVFFGTDADVEPWIDGWLPRFVEVAPHLPLLSSVLEKASSNPRQKDGVRWVRWMTAMLDGWSVEDEEEFLGPLLDGIDSPDLSEEFRARRQGRIDRTRAWVAEHPNGIERELTD